MDPDGEANFLFKAAGNYVTIIGTRCGSRALPKNYKQELLNIAMHGILSGEEEYAQNYLLYYYQTKHPNPSLSEVDRNAMLHDEEFSTGRTLHENLRANAKFMGRNIGGFFTPKYYENTFKREMDAVPDWYGDFKPAIGYINFFYTVAAELLITYVSTAIFSLGFSPIVIGATIIAGNTRPGQFQTRKARYKFQGNIERMLAPRGDINLGSIGMGLNIGGAKMKWNMSFKLSRNRFNNLGNAKKWRL